MNVKLENNTISRKSKNVTYNGIYKANASKSNDSQALQNIKVSENPQYSEDARKYWQIFVENQPRIDELQGKGKLTTAEKKELSDLQKKQTDFYDEFKNEFAKSCNQSGLKTPSLKAPSLIYSMNLYLKENMGKLENFKPTDRLKYLHHDLRLELSKISRDEFEKHIRQGNFNEIWQQMSKGKSILHNRLDDGSINPSEHRNVKYIDKTGRLEVVRDVRTNKIVTDPKNIGTFNFGHPLKEAKDHVIFDMIPYFIMGNSSDDPIKLKDNFKILDYYKDELIADGLEKLCEIGNNFGLQSDCSAIKVN